MFAKFKEEKICNDIGIICLILIIIPLMDGELAIIIFKFSFEYILFLKIILLIWMIVIFKLAFLIFQKYSFIKNTPISKLNSAAQGYITADGITAELPGKPLLSPITQQPCVWYNYTITEKEHIWGNLKLSSIIIILIKKFFNIKYKKLFEASTQEFIFKDANGQCLIDPENADIITKVTQVWYSDNLYEPKDFNKLLNKKNITKYSGKYKYEEILLLPDEKLYISGFFRSIVSPKVTEQEKNNHQEVLDLLKNWKKDYQALLEQFDTNKDGNIDAAEWERAVKMAEQTINVKYHTNDKTANMVNIISKQGLLFNQPFIIHVGNRATLQKKLNIKLFFYTLVFIFAMTILLSIDSWYIDVINVISDLYKKKH